MEERRDMNALEMIGEEASKENWTEEYRLKKHESGERDSLIRMSLGIAISQWLKYNGIHIIEVFQSALEDANYHSLNREITRLVEKKPRENGVETTYLGEWKQEGDIAVEIHECPQCKGLFGVDWTYLDQQNDNVVCPMCEITVECVHPDTGG
jgi:hypothetical protein